MNERFKIDRNKINEIVNKYREEIQNKYGTEKDAIQERYIDLVINTLGTDVLREAISCDVLKTDAQNILEGKPISIYYSDEESLKMLEGLSNYNIVGDWQHFRTVESQYLFKLPKNMQQLFAENFAIGNHDAKECLLKLWENHIETTGTDVLRESTPGSTNNITIQCYAADMRFMFETIR